VTAAPTDSSAFWEGSMPFGKPGRYAMNIPRLGGSCKYQYLGEMAYVWKTPEDIEEDTVFRLKLTTDIPPTTHFSGKIRRSRVGDSFSPSVRIEDADITGLANDAFPSSIGSHHSEVSGVSMANEACMVLAVVCCLLLACWAGVRLRRRSQRIILT
jgi:hypothetical protein